MRDRQRGLGLTLFLLLTFGLSWLTQAGLSRRFPEGVPATQMAVLGLIPGLVAVFVCAFVDRRSLRELGLRWGRGGRWYVAAWLLPAALGWAAFGVALLLHQGEFDTGFFQLNTALYLQQGGGSLPNPTATGLGVILFSLTLSLLPATLAGLGQEFGWRGYLLPRLLPLGRLPALLITGALAGLWYLPIMLHGTPTASGRVVGAVLLVGGHALFGVLLGWLRLASESVLVASVGRGSLEGPAAMPLALLRDRNDLTTGLTGLIGQALLLLFLLGLWRVRVLQIREPISEGDTHG